MKFLIYVIAAVFCLITTNSQAAEVAVIYSSWPQGSRAFLLEFDSTFRKMGYKFQKFENTRIPELTSQLDRFDMVVVSSTGNLENTVDLKPYSKKWQDYIRNGGVLFICDANYTSVLRNILDYVVPGSSLSIEHCTAYTKPVSEHKIKIPGDHPLLKFPAPAFKTVASVEHWSHFSACPQGWNVLETCVDNKPTIVAKIYGKGVIAAAVHSNLKDTAAGPYTKYLFTNMIAFTALKRHGISVLSAKIPGIDRHTAALDLKADCHTGASRIGMTVAHTSGDGIRETAASSRIHGKVITLEAPVRFEQRGTVTLQTTVTLDGKPVMVTSTDLQLPEYLVFKARRIHLYKDMPDLTLFFTVTPNNPPAQKCISWKINDGKSGNIAVSRNEFTYDFDISALPSGKHTLFMEYRENGRSIHSYSVDFFKHGTPVFAIRPDGTLLHHGKPFFPIGFYHVSRGLPLQSRMDMVKDIAKYGYNCVHVGIKAEEKNTNTYNEFLDECSKHGIFVISEFSGDRLETIRRYKHHPAVLGWNPGDEPAANGVPPEEMFRRYSSFKEEDPDHIAYTVICLANQYKNYASGSDILAPDPYPIPRGHAEDVFKIYSSAYAEARKYGTAMWSVPQCFGNCAGWDRTPTGREYRAMVYLALMAGAKGLINYTYHDGGFYLPENTDLYETCKKFPAELKELIPFILNGSRSIIRSGAGIYIAKWELNGEQAYAIVNASDDKNAAPVTFWINGNFQNYRITVGKLDKISAASTSFEAAIAPMESVLIFCK